MKKLITSLDAFGLGISLTMNKMTKSKTLIGGFLTIIMNLSLIAMFYISAQDLLDHSNPQIGVDSQILETRPPMNLNTFTMPISLSVSMDTNYVLELPEYFTYSFILWSGGTSDLSLTPSRFNVKKCKKENFPLISEEIFNDFLLYKNYCMENQDLTISGSWTEMNITYLTVKVEICKNSTSSNITCASEHEIFDFIKNNQIYLNVIIQDTIFNPYNAKNPVIYLLNTVYTSIKVGSHKIINIFLKNQTLISDDGFLFKTKNLFNSLSFDSQYYDDTNFEKERAFVEAAFYISANNITVNRRYAKIQEVLASIGGLANILHIVFMIICINFSTVRRDEVLLNEIFDFDLSSKKCGQNEKLPPEPNQLVDNLKFQKRILNENFYFSKSEISANVSFSSNLDSSRISNPCALKTLRKVKNFKIIKNNQEIKINEGKGVLNSSNVNNPKEIMELLEHRKKKYTLTFSYCDIIKTFFCCGCCRSHRLKEKINLYYKSKNFIMNFMDITYIIKKIEEFEKLKIVIFNSEQLALFNFISKEFISLNNEYLKSHKLTRMKTFVNNKEDLANTIINFRNKVYSNEAKVKYIDLKLFELINEELK
jgi:hypothetical protein